MQNILNNKIIRLTIIVTMIIVTAICVALVWMNAESSKLQYEINAINAEAQESTYKIANLEVKIQSATNVNNLEERALEMGLIHPGFDNIITLRNETSITDLAMALKRNARN